MLEREWFCHGWMSCAGSYLVTDSQRLCWELIFDVLEKRFLLEEPYRATWRAGPCFGQGVAFNVCLKSLGEEQEHQDMLRFSVPFKYPRQASGAVDLLAAAHPLAEILEPRQAGDVSSFMMPQRLECKGGREVAGGDGIGSTLRVQ